MSGPSPAVGNDGATDAGESALAGSRDLAARARRLFAASARFVGFWAAVALPFLYVPLLFGGLRGQRGAVFFSLLLLNAVALVAGRGYDPS